MCVSRFASHFDAFIFRWMKKATEVVCNIKRKQKPILLNIKGEGLHLTDFSLAHFDDIFSSQMMNSIENSCQNLQGTLGFPFPASQGESSILKDVHFCFSNVLTTLFPPPWETWQGYQIHTQLMVEEEGEGRELRNGIKVGRIL